MRQAVFVLALVLTLNAQTPTDQKLDRIANMQLKPGEAVDFSQAEINAWAAKKVPEVIPEGLRNPYIEVAEGIVTATAQVDFLKMRHAKGKQTNRLMAMMLEGERTLKITVRLSSYKGRATAFLTKVELNGAVIEGPVLEFLIQNFFNPLYPEAKINEPFDLDYNLDRIEAHPQQIRVVSR